MALVLLQSGVQPLGQFDAYDVQLTSIKGGEVCSFVAVTVGTDEAAADVADGYLNPGTTRPALTTTLVSGDRPLMLTDDGILHYGTLFGTVVGGTAGQTAFGPNSTVPAGDLLGPHTALGSGKWTAWDKPGLYGVTLDAVDTNATTGLQPSNATLTTTAPLYATAAGLLTPNKTLAFETSTGAGLVVGSFIEFSSNGSLVTTPNRLVSALNSPSSTLPASTPPAVLYMAVFHFDPNGSRYV